MSCQVIDVFITNTNTNSSNNYSESKTDDNHNKKNDDDSNNNRTIICAHDRNMLSFYDMEETLIDSIGAGKIQRSVQLSYKKANDGSNNCSDYRVSESYNDLSILRIAQVSLNRVYIECMGLNEKSQLSYFILSILLQPSLFVSECYLHVEELITGSLSRRTGNDIHSSSNEKNDNASKFNNIVPSDVNIDGNGSDDGLNQLPNGCLIFESKLPKKKQHENSSDVLWNSTISNNSRIDNNNTNKNTALSLITYGKKGVKLYSKQHPTESSTIMSQSTLKFNQLNKNNSYLFLALCDILSSTNEIPQDISEKGKEFRSRIAKQIRHPTDTRKPLQNRKLYVMHIEKGLLYSLPLSCDVIDIIPIDVDRTLVGCVEGVNTLQPVMNSVTTTTPATTKKCEVVLSQTESEPASDFDFYATQSDSPNTYSSGHNDNVQTLNKSPITSSTIPAQKLKPATSEREIIPDSPYKHLSSDSLFKYKPFSPISSIPLSHCKNLTDDSKCNNENSNILENLRYAINHDYDLPTSNQGSVIDPKEDCNVNLNDDADSKSSKRKRSDVINDLLPPASQEAKKHCLQDVVHVNGRRAEQTNSNDSNVNDINLDSYGSAGGIWKSLGRCLFVTQIPNQPKCLSSDGNPKHWNTSHNQYDNNNKNKNDDCKNNDRIDRKVVEGRCNDEMRFDHRVLLLHLPSNTPLKPQPTSHSTYNRDIHDTSIHSHSREGADNDGRDNKYVNKIQSGTLYITHCPLDIIQPKSNLSPSLRSSLADSSSSTLSSSTSSSSTLSSSAPSSSTLSTSASTPFNSLSSSHFSFENKVTNGTNFNSNFFEQIVVQNHTNDILNDRHYFTFTPKSSNYRAFCRNDVNNEVNRHKSILGLVVFSWSSNKSDNENNCNNIITRSSLYDISKITQ
jgi:hypothetical protein